MLLPDWLDGIRFRLFHRYFSGRASRLRRRSIRSRRRAHSALSVAAEVLEVRMLLAQPLPFDGVTFVVPGAPSQSVPYHFEFTSHEAAYTNETGIYVADDVRGRVGGLLPGAHGFAKAVLQSPNHRRLFTGSEAAGTTIDLTFRGGDRVSFYLIQNASAATFLKTNPRIWHPA